MARRRQVTRTNPSGVTAAPVAPEAVSTLLFCDAIDGATLAGGTDTTSGTIPLTVSSGTQRVFVSATIWGIEAGGWTLTFDMNLTHQWSDEYTTDMECNLTDITIDAELDLRERALVSMWFGSDGWDYDYQGQWGSTYWQAYYLSGVGTIPYPPSYPGYDPIRDRRYIRALYGSIHRKETQFGPYPGVNDFYRLLFGGAEAALPVTVPAGSYIGVWFEPDLVGSSPGFPLYIEYDIATGIGVLCPQVAMVGTVTFHFDGFHDNVVLSSGA